MAAGAYDQRVMSDEVIVKFDQKDRVVNDSGLDRTHIRSVAAAERRLPVIVRTEDTGSRSAACVPLGVVVSGPTDLIALAELVWVVDELLATAERAGLDPYRVSGRRPVWAEQAWGELCGQAMRPPSPADPERRVLIGLLRVGDQFAGRASDRVILLGQV